jgi:PhnB protein
MRSVYLSLTVEAADEAERIWWLLSDGGDIFMLSEETFFATRFGPLRDKFGTSWMILALKPQVATVHQQETVSAVNNDGL